MKTLLPSFIFFVLASLGFSEVFAQSVWRGLYEKKLWISETDTLPYRILLPENFDASKKYPVVFVLHGGGERGTDNERQLVYGASLFADSLNRTKFPAIVVFPQCPWDSYWANVIRTELPEGGLDFVFQPQNEPTKAGNLLVQLINSMRQKTYVDANKLYLGGLSMGGIGTLDILHRIPDVFAASFVICGGGNPEKVSNFAQKVDLWIFHGEKDTVVRPEYITHVIDSLQSQKASLRVTFYEDVGHNAWDFAFQEPDFLDWLFSDRE